MRRRRRPQVLFGSDRMAEWQEGIAHSRVFFALVSPAYLRTPRLWDHIAYARELGKPFRVAVIEGAQIPDGFFAGVADLEIRHCATPEEVAAYALEVCRG
jgi:hypothetical protein